MIENFDIEAIKYKAIPGGWLSIDTEPDIHVVPAFDVIIHEEFTCKCNPVVERINTGAGDLVFMYLHNAIDGRE